MLLSQKKKIASVLIGSGSKKPDFVQRMGEAGDTKPMEMDEAEEMDGNMALIEASKKLLAAIKSDDAKLFADALKDADAILDSLAEDSFEDEA